MRVIFCKYRKKLYTGNLPTCLTWAGDVAKEKNLVIPVFIIRAGEKEARLIYEVCREGIRPIRSRQYARLLKGAVWETL
jgi:hypothetical protein